MGTQTKRTRRIETCSVSCLMKVLSVPGTSTFNNRSNISNHTLKIILLDGFRQTISIFTQDPIVNVSSIMPVAFPFVFLNFFMGWYFSHSTAFTIVSFPTPDGSSWNAQRHCAMGCSVAPSTRQRSIWFSEHYTQMSFLSTQSVMLKFVKKTAHMVLLFPIIHPDSCSQKSRITCLFVRLHILMQNISDKTLLGNSGTFSRRGS